MFSFANLFCSFVFLYAVSSVSCAPGRYEHPGGVTGRGHSERAVGVVVPPSPSHSVNMLWSIHNRMEQLIHLEHQQAQKMSEMDERIAESNAVNVKRFDSIQSELKGIQQKLQYVQRQNMVNEDNIIHMKKDIEVVRKRSELGTENGVYHKEGVTTDNDYYREILNKLNSLAIFGISTKTTVHKIERTLERLLKETVAK